MRLRPFVLPLVAGLVAAAAPLAVPPTAAAVTDAAAADAEVAFAFGVAAYHRGDFEEAVERLGAAVAADPGDGTARYWLGLARLELGDGARAESELAAARDAERPPRVDPERLRRDLARARAVAAGREPAPTPPPAAATRGLDRFGELPAWELELRGAVGDDSNPALVADGVLSVAPDGTLLDGAEADRVIQLGGRFDLRPVRRGDWTLGLAVAADRALYDELDFLDFTRLAGTVHLAWGGDPAGFLSGPLGSTRVPVGHRRAAFLLQAGVSDDELDGEGLATTSRLAGSLFLRQGAVGTTRLSAAYADEDFDDDGSGDLEASGTVTEAAVEQTFYLGPRNRYLRLSATAGERDAGAAFDSSHTRAGAELGLPLGDAWTLSLVGGWSAVDYDGVESNPLFGFLPVDEVREDSTVRLAAVLSWAVTPRLLLVARGARTDRDADLGPVAEQFFDFDYERTVVAVGFRWFFLPGGAR